MPIPAFTPAWADALVAAVNADEAYRDAGRGWTNVVALVVEPDESISGGAAVEVDLNAGECLGAAALLPDAVSAPFVLSGGLAAWKEVVGGTGDPMVAVATGALKLTRGSLTTLMMHSRSAKALLVCARQIDTLWP